MKYLYFIFFSIFITTTSNSIAQNIAIINVQLLIDKNKYYIEVIQSIENNQQIFLEQFENKEKELNAMLINIEESKMILNENELNIQITNYNKELNNFKISVEEFNIHFQNQIILIRESVLKQIIALIEKYAIDNNIDLILDSTSYLIASNSIDITEKIGNELNKIILNLEYKNFEKN